MKSFLISFASDHGLECPRGRGSQDESPIRILHSSFTRRKVCEQYKIKWSSLNNAVLEISNRSDDTVEPLSYNLFIRYWNSDFSLLRIAKSGSDFCVLCTVLKFQLAQYSTTDIRRQALKEKMDNHLKDAESEFRNYKTIMKDCSVEHQSVKRHFVFDFAEKILLPKLLNQPGQLHFKTGLKLDINGVYCSNTGKTNLFALVEGHWPSDKTANSVLSMLHYTISRPQNSLYSNCLYLHADNCTGQNKKQFVLFYLL